MPNAYWLRLRFEPEVVAIIKEALKTKLWSGTDAERLEKLRTLARALSAHYRMPVPEIVIAATQMGPHFLPGQRKIVLDKASLVSMLHELAHAILDHRGEAQNEEFPRAWSLGLFYAAAPRLFAAARQSGRLLYTEGGDRAEY